jgi:hypothetical protein
VVLLQLSSVISCGSAQLLGLAVPWGVTPRNTTQKDHESVKRTCKLSSIQLADACSLPVDFRIR